MSDFFDPEFKDITVTRHGKQRTFRGKEISGDDAELLFDIRGKDGKTTDPNKSKGLDNRIISKFITYLDDNGAEVPISAKEAGQYPVQLRKKLIELALEMAGVKDDEEGEKN